MRRMPQPKLGILTVTFLCAGLLAVGLIVEELAWLSPLKVGTERTLSLLPDSLAVPLDELERPGSVLSVSIEERYLRDPDYGLLNHREQRGRDWEHPAVMSYFEDGVLEFTSPVGLRLHGGHSRKRREDRISMRLYFRRDYGSAEFRPSAIFDGKRNPIRQLIIDKDALFSLSNDWGVERWYLNNALAYDIARQVGALAPEVHPVSFVFNGNPRGLHVLVEPVRVAFLESRFGHGNFQQADLPSLQRPSKSDEFSQEDPWQRQSFLEVLEELKTEGGGPFTLTDASRWIDVRSLTRWFVSIVFCATTDPFQAAILRDRTRPDSLWFWVNWDMDRSFMDLFHSAPVPWLEDTFRMTLESKWSWDKGNMIESYLIERLLAEDPAYRDYLAQEFLDALNYRLTPTFLDERYRHYRTVVERFGLGDEPYLEILAKFLEFRPAYVREQLVRELDLASLRNVQLKAPRDAGFRIDNHAITPGFSGWYVPGTEISVEISGGGQSADFSHWIVDGRRVESPEFSLKIEEDIVIEAEFHP